MPQALPVAVLLRGGGEPRGSHVGPHGRLGLVTQLLAAPLGLGAREAHVCGRDLALPPRSCQPWATAFLHHGQDRKEGGHPRLSLPGQRGRCQVGEVGAFNRLTHPGDDDSAKGELVGLEGPGRTL